MRVTSGEPRTSQSALTPSDAAAEQKMAGDSRSCQTSVFEKFAKEDVFIRGQGRVREIGPAVQEARRDAPHLIGVEDVELP